MKQCIICKQWKDESEFYKRSETVLRNNCKACHNKPLTDIQKQNKSIYDKNYYQQNKLKISLQNRLYRKEHKEEILAKERKYNTLNRERILIRKKNYNKRYYECNKQNILKQRKFNYTNTKYGIDRLILNAFQRFFSNPNKNIECDLNYYGLDYSFTNVKSRFDILLKELNLDYKDYGLKWELDHIIPRNKFNYNSVQDEQFKTCWSLDNLRPLLCSENRSRPKDGSDVI